MEIAEEMMDWSEELKIKALELKNGGKIIDSGINVTGGYEAGLLFTEICMGGLGGCSVSVHEIGGIPLAF